MGLRFLRALYLAARRLLLGSGISLIPPFSWIKRAALQRLRHSSRIPVQGSWMRLDPLDRLNLGVNGVYEPEDTAFAKAVIRPGDTIVDVGANIGYYTCLFSRLTGPSGRVLAFEPAPDMFEIVSDNLRFNHYDQASVLQNAVTESSGPLTLFMEEGRPEDNRIFNDGESPRTPVPIQGVCLDDIPLLKEFPPDFIKMDIQGAEIFAVRGMRRILRESPRLCILLEFWPYGILRAGFQPADLITCLQDAGLRVCRVTPHLKLEPVDPSQTADLCPIGIGDYINLVAAPPDRMEQIQAALP